MVLNHIVLSDGMGNDVSLLCLQSSVGHWFEPHLGTVVVGSLQGGRERGAVRGGYILINIVYMTDLFGIAHPECDVIECNESTIAHRLCKK